MTPTQADRVVYAEYTAAIASERGYDADTDSILAGKKDDSHGVQIACIARHAALDAAAAEVREEATRERKEAKKLRRDDRDDVLGTLVDRKIMRASNADGLADLILAMKEETK